MCKLARYPKRVLWWCLYVKEAKLSAQRVWKAVFCLPGHVGRRRFSQANCPISGELSRRGGTQRCLSRLDPHSAMSRGEVKGQVGRSLPASQPAKRALAILMADDDTSILYLLYPSIRGPILSKPCLSQNTPHPHLHQVVCYDFMIIYGALSGCACTFTTPSWSPLITGPRCRQSRRDGGAC